MIKTIVKDVFFLGQKSTEATKEDLYLAKDLRDTLEFHKDACVGMAANMIGVKK
ncbi:MAG: peptide deformylase, partial [Enterococcus aquimarinus]